MEATPASILKNRSRLIRAAIRRVFLDVWDPIGIRDEPNAQDEYDRYVGCAFELLVAGATDRQIEEYLIWIVARMGMDGSLASHKDVIAALREIDLSSNPHPSETGRRSS
jgi:hypothetical protein